VVGIKNVTIYTDGACIGNPGPGGYAAVVVGTGVYRQVSGGFRRTTNNRMEIMAAIAGLEALKEPSKVTLYSDSEYLVKAMALGWARKWRSKGWMRTSTQKALNADLWERLLALSERHQVEFRWVPGHNGVAGNELCDRLAVEAAKRRDLPEDRGYSPRRWGR